jgi:hypothetical protein
MSYQQMPTLHNDYVITTNVAQKLDDQKVSKISCWSCFIACTIVAFLRLEVKCWKLTH